MQLRHYAPPVAPAHWQLQPASSLCVVRCTRSRGVIGCLAPTAPPTCAEHSSDSSMHSLGRTLFHCLLLVGGVCSDSFYCHVRLLTVQRLPSVQHRMCQSCLAHYHIWHAVEGVLWCVASTASHSVQLVACTAEMRICQNTMSIVWGSGDTRNTAHRNMQKAADQMPAK